MRQEPPLVDTTLDERLLHAFSTCCGELLVEERRALGVRVPLHLDLQEFRVLLEHARNLVEQRVGNGLDRRLCRVELHLLQNDDLGLRHADGHWTTMLGCVGQVRFALLVRTSVLVVANSVAIRIRRTTVCRGIRRLDALDIDAGIFRIDDAVTIAIRRTTVLRGVWILDARHVHTRILRIDDSVAILVRRAAVLLRIRIRNARHVHTRILRIDDPIAVSIGRTAMLLRIGIRYTRHFDTCILRIDDPIAIGILRLRRRRRHGLLHQRRILHGAEHAELRRTNTRGETRTTGYASFEVFQESVTRIEQHFEVCRAIEGRIIDVIHDKPGRDLGPDLQVSASEQHAAT